MPTCMSCGEENPEHARFCLSCGSSLSPKGEGGIRKRVTILFCDVVGSTAIGEALDPESLRHVMDRYFDTMRESIERHGGLVEKFIGDAVMAVFGVPVIHEDDALRAVRSSVEMRDRLEDLNKELERDVGIQVAHRIGIWTGAVITGSAGSNERIVTGDAVNSAARLEQAAESGQILMGAPTYDLVHDAVHVSPVAPIAAKGKSDPLGAYAVIRIAPGMPGVARRTDSALVGRTRELRLLDQALERAVTDRTCQLVTVLGPAGVGKSRLVEEFITAVGDSAEVVRARCLPYGDGITFWPVVEMITSTARITPVDGPAETRARIVGLLGERADAEVIAERLAHLVGLADAEAVPEETFWAVRKLLEALAAERPLVVDLDDVHWAETTMLDLIEHVADWSRDAPILLLCSARPELLDERPAWGGGKLNATSFLLEPLGLEEIERLVTNLLGAHDDAPPDLLERIASASEGNPLFAEQTLAMLVDGGAIAQVDRRWVWVDHTAAMAVPPTIQALLEARLDRLEPNDRVVMGAASIEGKVFHRGGVLALVDDPIRGEVDRRLMALVRRDLIRAEPSNLEGEDAFRFRHLLIRDAAYDRLAKERRAELHERFATWLGEVAGRQTVELDEIAGYHLERSVLLRRELGPTDGSARATALRAGRLLNAAGDRAAERGDAVAAVDLWVRAFALLPGNDPDTYERLGSIRQAYFFVGQGAESESFLTAAAERADQAELPTQAAYARAMAAFVRTGREVAATATEAVELIEETERSLAGPRHRLARGWCRFCAAICHHWLGRIERSAELARAALDDATDADDRFLARSASDWVGAALMWGPLPIERVLRHAEDEAARGYSSLPGVRAQAEALALSGRFAEASAVVAQNRDRARELGQERGRIVSGITLGIISLFAHRPEEAERDLRAGYEELMRLSDLGFGATVAGYLGLALYGIGDDEAAAALIEEWGAKTAPDDYEALVLQGVCLSCVRTRQGATEEAVRIARDAIDTASGSDDLIRQGEAFLALANALAASDRKEEAAIAVRGALARFERKGDVVEAADARELLEQLGV